MILTCTVMLSCVCGYVWGTLQCMDAASVLYFRWMGPLISGLGHAVILGSARTKRSMIPSAGVPGVS
jgi:hypothetical protein